MTKRMITKYEFNELLATLTDPTKDANKARSEAVALLLVIKSEHEYQPDPGPERPRRQWGACSVI